MKTVTPSANCTVKTPVGPEVRRQNRAAGARRVAGRSSSVSLPHERRASDSTKVMLIGLAAAAVAVLTPGLLIWLMLPVLPALLLRAARRDRLLPGSVALLRVFTIATFGAATVLVMTSGVSLVVGITSLAAAAVFLGGLEWFAVR